MKKLFTFVSLAFVTLQAYANYGLPDDIPTPNAVSLGSYGIIPVSHYAGKPDISIPLYTFEYKGFSLPVSLNYAASGVNVNELPGWCGHNWSVSAGGVITRSVRGKIDEYNPFHCNYSSSEARSIYGYQLIPDCYFPNYFVTYDSVQLVTSKLLGTNDMSDSVKPADTIPIWFSSCRNKEDVALLSENRDMSPDLFFFNFLGYSGCFFLGHDGQWKVQSESNLDIIFDITDKTNYISPFIPIFVNGQPMEKTIKGFTIRDDKGYLYEFGGTVGAIDYSTPFFDMGQWNAISWYLTKIADKFGNTLYTFEYERGKYIVQMHNYKEIYAEKGIMDDGWWGHLEEASGLQIVPFNYSININSPVYLKKISANNGVVGVFESRDNEDKDEEGNDYMSFRNLYRKFSNWYYDTNGAVNMDSYNWLCYLGTNPSSLDQCRMKDYCFFYLRRNFDGSDFTEITKYKEELKDYQYYPDILAYKFGDEEDIFARTRVRKLNCIYFTEEPDSKYEPHRGIGYQFHYSYSGRMHLEKMLVGNAQDIINAQTLQSMGNSSYQDPMVRLDDKFDTICAYRFRYDHFGELPGDYLTTSDAWGYYNGGSKLEMWDAGFREPDPYWAKVGSLKEIQYPTGGTTEFEYEQNQYGRYLSEDKKTIIECENKNCGGLRIASITNWDSPFHTKIISKKVYSYSLPNSSKSSGIITNRPKFVWDGWEGHMTDGGTWLYYVMKNEPILSLGNLFGPNFGYACVKETNMDGSYIINWFSTASDSVLRDERFFVEYKINKEESSPFDSYISDKSFMRGKLLLSSTYDSKGIKVKSTGYKYRNPEELNDKYEIMNCFGVSNKTMYIPDIVESIFISSDTTIWDDSFMVDIPLSERFVRGGLYKAFYSRLDLLQENDTVFEASGNIITKTIYGKRDYALELKTPYIHKTDIRVTSSVQRLNLDRIYKENYGFSRNFESPLYQFYFHLIPDSVNTYVDNVLAKTTRTEYKRDRYGHYLPFKHQEKIGTNGTFKDKVVCMAYNGRGNLTKYEQNGVVVDLTWDETDNHILGMWKDKLYTHFAYDNLFGIKRVINPNGIASCRYSYDNIGRLVGEEVYNNLTKYVYNYANCASIVNNDKYERTPEVCTVAVGSDEVNCYDQTRDFTIAYFSQSVTFHVRLFTDSRNANVKVVMSSSNNSLNEVFNIDKPNQNIDLTFTRQLEPGTYAIRATVDYSLTSANSTQANMVTGEESTFNGAYAIVSVDYENVKEK